jgi:hypothetical protein
LRFGSVAVAFEAMLEHEQSLVPPKPEKKRDPDDEEEEDDDDEEETIAERGVVSAATLRMACHMVSLANAQHRLIEYLDPESTNEISLEDIDQDATLAAQKSIEDKILAIAAKLKRDKRAKREHMLKAPPPIQVAVGVQARNAERDLEPGQKMIESLKRTLQAKHGNLVRAWRKVFVERIIDPETFSDTLQAQGVQGDAEAAWEALDLGNKNLTLERFEPSIVDDLDHLRAKIVDRYGSAEMAFQETNKGTNFKLKLDPFLALCYECQFRRNERRLFEYLDKNGNGEVNLRDIDKTAVEYVKKHPAAKSHEDDDPREKIDKVNPVTAFRAFVTRKFASPLKAWKAIDVHGQSGLTIKEFCARVAVTGYGGNPRLLFIALLGGEPKEGALLSLKEFEPDGFKRLTQFRTKVCAKHGDLKSIFVQEEWGQMPEPTKKLNEQAFYGVCQEIKAPAPWGKVYHLLANADGDVTWEDTKFLAEQWTWKKGGQPIRKKAPADGEARPTGQYRGSPARVSGDGPLATTMRPMKVSLTRSTTLPDLTPPIRAQWNERFQIKDTVSNKTEQLIHLMAYVQTQQSERIERRISQKCFETPTIQLLREHAANRSPLDDPRDNH